MRGGVRSLRAWNKIVAAKSDRELRYQFPGFLCSFDHRDSP